MQEIEPRENPTYDNTSAGCPLCLTENLDVDECQSSLSGVNTIYMIPRSMVKKQSYSISTSVDNSYACYANLTEQEADGDHDAPWYEPYLVGKCDNMFSVYCSRDLGELKYAPQGDNVGSRSMKATLEVHHPSFHARALSYFGHMINREWIIIVRLNNGEYHILGDVYRGAILSTSSEATSGKASTDQNGITLQFEWDVEMPRILARTPIARDLDDDGNLDDVFPAPLADATPEDLYLQDSSVNPVQP